MKEDLRRYLQEARDAMLWKLDGLGEYDLRRPLTPTGTNLLGLVKHLAGVEAGYFGETFGRPFPEQVPWYAPGAHPNADLWATAEESREAVISFYRRVWAHADATIEALPLDGRGEVPWWHADNREVTLHKILVHVIAESHRHAGHADIVRELIDGAAGLGADRSNLPVGKEDWWAEYRATVEQAARDAAAASER
jgi:uncharacterized damage-inducible protein DinB